MPDRRRRYARTPLERAEAIVGRSLASLPAGVKRALAGAPIERDGLRLDLDTQLLLRLNARPALSSRTPAQARADLARSARVAGGRPAVLAEVADRSVAGTVGRLAARLYVPPGDDGGLVVFFHGGGHVAGDIDSHDAPCRLLALHSGRRVLSVAYRLAPEHRFPAAVDDALAAFRDTVAQASALGADPRRIAVGGDSAGGHLAAVTAQLAARDATPPAFQLLIYPVTDMAGAHASRDLFADGFLLTRENIDWYERNFLDAAQDRRDPRVSPLRTTDLAGVAPALVVTAGFDPLRDEGEAYARRLREAGVRTVLRRHPGYVHGFIGAVGLAEGPRTALAEIGGVLRASF